MFASAHSSLIIIVAETIAALLSFALCLAAVRMRFGLNEVVERSNHKVPTPRTGGLMALIALFGASALLGATGLIDREVALLLGVTALAGGLGAADDFLNLPAIPKLLGQIVIACTLTFLLGPEQELPLPFLGWIELPSVVAFVLTILWIVGIMNVINFMDGLNGLVGSVTLLVLLAAGFLAPNAQALLMVTCAAIVGFLAVNVFWGRIFLGDAGSQALGVLVGGAALLTPDGSGSFWLLPLMVLPLIADVGWTLVTRFLDGEDLTAAHQDHFYQRQKKAGWSHQAVAVSLFASALAAVLLTRVIDTPTEHPATLYWIVAFLIAAFWFLTNVVMAAAKGQNLVLERTLR